MSSALQPGAFKASLFPLSFAPEGSVVVDKSLEHKLRAFLPLSFPQMPLLMKEQKFDASALWLKQAGALQSHWGRSEWKQTVCSALFPWQKKIAPKT